MYHTTLGIPIIENEILVVDGEPYQRRRSWRERLFTRPWRPWRATKWVVPKIPDPNIYVSNIEPWGKRIYAHPVTAQRIREHLENS